MEMGVMCVTNFTKNGECSKCGNCCTPVIPITEEEVKKIREYIKENDIKMVMPITKEGRHIKCCFYDFENHRCNIYPVRPEVCRKFICSLNNKEIDKNKEYYDKICPAGRRIFRKSVCGMYSWL